MARLIKNDYEDYDYGYDIDGPYHRTPYCCWYEEDGLKFKFFPKEGKKAYVYGILENVESVKTPDFLRTGTYGDAEVSIWNVWKDTPGSKTIKHISFGKCIREITLASCEDFSSLETVQFDASVKSLDYSFFKGCKNLKSISFRDDSPLTSISYECFQNCESLNDIRLPKNIVSVEPTAFDGCKKLKHITILSDNKELIDDIASIKSIEKISVETATKKTTYLLHDIEIIRKNIEIREKKRIEEERIKHKFSTFDNYQVERSKFRNNYTALVCAIPFIWMMYRYIVFDVLVRDYSHYSVFGAFVGVVGLFVIYTIMWFVSFMLAMYWDFCSKERNCLYSMIFPLLAVPASMFITYIVLTILSVFVSCESSIASIFDPRFIN